MASKQQKLIKTLDTLVSKLIRERDKDKPCIDLCGDRQGIAQAGHFRPRWMMSTRFDPQNINKQWRNCNYYRSHKNDLIRHRLGIDQRWGAGKADELYELSGQYKNWGIPELETLIKAAKEGYETYVKAYTKLST